MPNTIEDNLTRLQNARTAISTAITNKGGTVPTGAGFEDFPTAINTIAGNTATITSAPPISFRSNGDNLVDWEIEGSSGGVGERTKNLLDISNVNNHGYRGISAKEEDGALHIYGKSNQDAPFIINLLTPDKPTPADTNFLLEAGTYTLSGMVATTNSMIRLQIVDVKGTETSLGLDDGSGFTFTLADDSIVRVRINIRKVAYNVPVDITVKPMLRKADTSPNFIPYGYEIPVTCGGKTTDIFIGDSPLTEGESITKAEANVDIPTLNGNNNLVVDTVAQPDSVTIQYYNYVAGIPYNTDGLCLYFPNDIGRVRILPQTDHEPDVSSLNSAPYSFTGFDDTSIEVRFTMPENFTDKARLIELGNHDGMILALNLNENNIEVCANGTWAESFSTTFTGGETYTLAVTIGSGDIKIYVDGVYAEADTYTTFTVAGPIISFANGGAIGMDTRWFPATSDISKVRVYDRVLTAAEIAANYQIDSPT